MIRRSEGNHTVALMCRSLKVSRSGYYEWRSRPPSKRTQANTALTENVRRVYAENKGRAGAPRITKQLQQEGHPVGKNRVARLMRAEQLRPKAARKYKATTNSNHSLPVAPNVLAQNFSADAPNRKWVSDISVPQQAA
jgi:putative transposase